jgi:hypothetical protein
MFKSSRGALPLLHIVEEEEWQKKKKAELGGEIIYGLLKFMFHSSCSMEKRRAGMYYMMVKLGKPLKERREQRRCEGKN